jgi:aspartoacylase
MCCGTVSSSSRSIVRVCEWLAGEEPPYVPSVGASGFTFEIGAVANGCVDSRLFLQSDRLVRAALAFIQEHNNAVADGRITGQASMIDIDNDEHEQQLRATGKLVTAIDVFRKVGSIDYPRFDDGQLAGMIHPSLQVLIEQLWSSSGNAW